MQEHSVARFSAVLACSLAAKTLSLCENTEETQLLSQPTELAFAETTVSLGVNSNLTRRSTAISQEKSTKRNAG